MQQQRAVSQSVHLHTRTALAHFAEMGSRKHSQSVHLHTRTCSFRRDGLQRTRERGSMYLMKAGKKVSEVQLIAQQVGCMTIFCCGRPLLYRSEPDVVRFSAGSAYYCCSADPTPGEESKVLRKVPTRQHELLHCCEGVT